jgi:ADP-dependent NAD(P)H-hydrate dehydratase / NAD(P)H-hydrate epimerase
MKLLSAKQIKEWDQYTITFEPISSIDLMERASLSFTRWFVEKFPDTRHPVSIFCGNGNNGGDGLAIARLLRNKLYDVEVFILKLSQKDSPDFSINLKRLQDLGDISIQYCEEKLPDIAPKSIIIDALLGTGTQRAVTGYLGELIENLNQLENTIVAVDLPSGLPADAVFMGPTIIADFVFTFQIPKLSFFYKENERFCPQWVVGDIGLHLAYFQSVFSIHHLIDMDVVSKILKKRPKHGHKGTFGHAAIIAGSFAMPGAAVLSTLACIRSGVGLVTAMVPDVVTPMIQNNVPEALTISTGEEIMDDAIRLNRFTGIGIGPGLYNEEATFIVIEELLDHYQQPMVLDADALNLLSTSGEIKLKIPKNSIITPHPKELTRWVGECNNEIEMFAKAKDVALNLGIIVVLKGAYTRIFLPDGSQYINSTGNNGMATAGSGDVLTGIITGLLAQGYEPHESAILGVFLHGLAGDLALKNQSEESLIARDIIDHLGAAFTKIKKYTPSL